MSEKFYNILGVSEKATKDEIKRAYRSLQLKWHPDKFQFNTNPDITEIDFHETFQAVSRAYSTLSDEIKREKYDRNGKNDLNVDDTSDDETCCTWLLHIFEILKEKCSDSKRRS